MTINLLTKGHFLWFGYKNKSKSLLIAFEILFYNQERYVQEDDKISVVDGIDLMEVKWATKFIKHLTIPQDCVQAKTM